MSVPTPIALITGGSRGLGRNAAEYLARQGTDVILTYRNGSVQAGQVVTSIEALGRRGAALPLDVADSGAFPTFAESVKRVLAGWERESFDFLINNAGHGEQVAFAETTEAQFDELMRVHLKAPYFLTQTLLPLIADGGRILNVSSGLTRFSFPGYSAYAVMKGGVEVLSRYLARELGTRGISVNTLAPGAIETDFGGGAVRDNPEVNRVFKDITALGRAGLPDDIGAVVAALLAPGTGWVNGQRIEASGGTLL
ncbi:MAG: SDR family oxidoreductase [Pseudoxanthomonas sp.]